MASESNLHSVRETVDQLIVPRQNSSQSSHYLREDGWARGEARVSKAARGHVLRGLASM